jgi:hypothetical protein
LVVNCSTDYANVAAVSALTWMQWVESKEFIRPCFFFNQANSEIYYSKNKEHNNLLSVSSICPQTYYFIASHHSVSGWPEDWKKIAQSLEKIAKLVAKPKKCQFNYIKAEFERLKHLQQTTYETSKYPQHTIF